jgi:protein-S-isoprenylcysteine O-methyltransferase Ste14
VIFYILDVFTIISLFAVFSIIHSILASPKLKFAITKKVGNLIAFYRLAYNIFSLFSLYLIYELSPKPNVIIYDLTFPFDLIVLVPQLAALGGIFWSFKYICVKEFLGVSQIKRYFQKSYSSELDEEMTLTIGGPYKYSRHPVYFFTIMFLLFRPTMDLFYLTFFICIVLYFYVGSIYEEKKLIIHFGDIYLRYQKSVPRILPALPLRAYNTEEFADT